MAAVTPPTAAACCTPPAPARSAAVAPVPGASATRQAPDGTAKTAVRTTAAAAALLPPPPPLRRPSTATTRAALAGMMPLASHSWRRRSMQTLVAAVQVLRAVEAVRATEAAAAHMDRGRRATGAPGPAPAEALSTWRCRGCRRLWSSCWGHRARRCRRTPLRNWCRSSRSATAARCGATSRSCCEGTSAVRANQHAAAARPQVAPSWRCAPAVQARRRRCEAAAAFGGFWRRDQLVGARQDHRGCERCPVVRVLRPLLPLVVPT
mmetsp:Transcript_19503/g.57809  ORF Transcript_19503/g.57809 Transcript_19503/m.57809 type:complete len:265 (+) Transcript_19503:1057-1851(+)